jgi:regulatory protein
MGEMRFQITGIEPQKKNKHRRSIYLDGAYAFGLDEEIVVKFHLHEGDEITQEGIDSLRSAEERAVGKKQALRLISYRARSTNEVRQRLIQKRISEDAADHVIEDLLRVGLLDDRAFASSYVHTRMIQKPISKSLLIKELVSKGIEAGPAKTTVDREYGELSEAQVAAHLIRKRLRPGKKDARERKRLSDFLLRRGFEWHVIDEALQDVSWETEE